MAAGISIKGWVFHSDKDGFFDGPCQIMIFSVHNAKVVDDLCCCDDHVMGDWALRCSLYLLANVLPDSSMYSSSQSTLQHLYLYISPPFCQMVSLSLGLTRRSFMLLSPLKCIYMPCLLHIIFSAFT